MSEQAPEQRGKKENIFTHKIGPLPMWVWLLLALGLLLGWAWYQNKKNPTSSSPTNTANASQVPQFVNQTYTTVTPPSTPGKPVDKDTDTDDKKKKPPGKDDNGDSGKPDHDRDKDDTHKKKPPNRRHPHRPHDDHGDNSPAVRAASTGVMMTGIAGKPGELTPPTITPKV